MSATERMPDLLEAYFADLDRALIGTAPREHAETVQAMREHAAEMLSLHGNSEQTAERVIADFGPVDDVASATTAAPAVPAPAEPRSWADIWLLVGSVAGLVYFVFPLLSIAMLTWAVLRRRQHKGNQALQKAALWVSIAAVVVSVGLFTLRLVRIL